MKITANKIIFGAEDFLYGFNPQSNIGCPTVGRGADYLASFNPFRYLGKACPGFNPTDALNYGIVDDLLVSGLLASDGYAYAVGGDYLYRITPLNGVLTNTGSFPYQISGATMKDIVEYNVSGDVRLFISWYDGTDGDVAIVTMNGTTPTIDNDFMSTVPTGAAAFAKDKEMPMAEGTDGKLYIGVGKNLHQYNGNTNTLVPNKIVLPNNWEIKSFSLWEQMDYLVIYAEKSGGYGVRAFIWDYESSQHLYSLLVDGNSCGGGFNKYKGTFGVFTQGHSVDPSTNLRGVYLNIFNGERFKRIISLPVATTPIHGGVNVLGNMIRANCAGNIYSYGYYSDGLGVGLHHLGSSGTLSGMLLMPYSNMLLASSASSDSLKIYSSNYNTGSFASIFAEPIFPIGKKGMVTAMTVYFNKTCSGGRGVSISTMSRDASASAVEYFTNISTISSKNLVIRRIGAGLNRTFDAIQVFLSYTSGSGETDAPVISQIVLDYKTINI